MEGNMSSITEDIIKEIKFQLLKLENPPSYTDAELIEKVSDIYDALINKPEDVSSIDGFPIEVMGVKLSWSPKGTNLILSKGSWAEAEDLIKNDYIFDEKPEEATNFLLVNDDYFVFSDFTNFQLTIN